jgi:phosphate transport system permease protein
MASIVDRLNVAGGGAQASVAAARPTFLGAFGEPYVWMMGGALALGVAMIAGFLLLVVWNGVLTFWPKPIAVVTLRDGNVVAGESTRTERYRPGTGVLADLPEALRQEIEGNAGFAARTLYRIGNFDLYGEDFQWISDFEVAETRYPGGLLFVERLEWGPFIGRIARVELDGRALTAGQSEAAVLRDAHRAARERWERIERIESVEIGAVNHELEAARLELRSVALESGEDSAAYREARARTEVEVQTLEAQYRTLAEEARQLRERDGRDRLTLAEIGGRKQALPLSAVVRFYPANALDTVDRIRIYLSRWGEFVSEEPREANTEGGVLPAIFGTAAMTLLMVVAVAPFGIVTALYLREYAKQGRLVSIVRISVNNLAGVPSIVYGVFGLGFFAYVIGARIDELFYAERLPAPTFGTGGLLWSSLTLALLTVPVVIVATEEALAAVPRSMREGSLACGASKWQTIRKIVLPRAMPGIMTGIILAMARGAGEVAPLMLVGVVKLAPELPIDGFFPYVHLERSFMHLGFHIYDVGFQSRNSEAGKPMVFVTTMLLIALIFLMNLTAIIVRSRLKRRFAGGQF